MTGTAAQYRKARTGGRACGAPRPRRIGQASRTGPSQSFGVSTG